MHEAGGKKPAKPDAQRRQQLLKESAGRSGDAEDRLENTQGNDEEQGRAKDGCKAMWSIRRDHSEGRGRR